MTNDEINGFLGEWLNGLLTGIAVRVCNPIIHQSDTPHVRFTLHHFFDLAVLFLFVVETLLVVVTDGGGGAVSF